MRFRIDLKIFIFLILFYFTKQIEPYAYIMIFALIHELGHLIAGLLLGMKPEKIEIMPFGVSISFKIQVEEYNRKIKKGNILELKKIIVAIAGPITNFIIILLLDKLNIKIEKGIIIIYTNLLIAIFNLLPIYPLDGGRILKGILHINFGKIKSERYINLISKITLIVITAITSILILYLKNISIFIINMYLLYLVIIGDIKLKKREDIYKKYLKKKWFNSKLILKKKEIQRMKDKLKQNKGVTMIALVATIVILLILTNMLIYNAQDSVHIQAINNLYSDIELLRNKVSAYYHEYGQIPAEIQYTNISQLQNANILSQNNDIIDEFYVIDLEAMQGITLNYGKDYENIKLDEKNADNYTDVYIINKNSHNIFYAEGIAIQQDEITSIYYTDYIEPDETTIDLRYIEGILIPDGYYYTGEYTDGSGNESLVISNNKDENVDETSENQYIWQKQISVIEQVPATVVLSEDDGQNEDEFIKSVNHYKGYFKNAITNKVVYLPVKENKWSEVCTENTEYTDKNGDTAYIPKGFRVSLAEGTNEVRSGLVITDEIDENGNSTGNEFVWIPVNDFYEFTREDFGENPIDEENFSTDQLTEEIYYEPSANGRTVDATEETNMQEVQKMYKSVKTYRGFYIGRYETGIEAETARTAESGITDTPVIKKNKYIYNYITWGNSMTDETGGAIELARSMYENSTLCYGVQWDAIMRWINQDTSINYILEDSTTKGNYNESGNLIKTGNYEEYQVKNIYDLAGNVSEWTMESFGTAQKVVRGGQSGGTDTVTFRIASDFDAKLGTNGFRVALYL